MIYELGFTSPAVQTIDREILARMEGSPYQIELYREFMETTLFSDPSMQEKFREWFHLKYSTRRPDVIIAAGPSPLRFVAEMHGPFFERIPVVFCGTSFERAGSPKMDEDFTGVWETFEPEKTVEAALRLKPDTKHVFVVGGTSAFDRALEELYRKRLSSYEAKLAVTYLTELAMPDLLERLRQIPRESIVLITHVGRDAAGQRFVGAAQANPMITAAANAPVFGPSDVDFGHGEVGGWLSSFGEQGKVAGAMALRILGGEKAENIPIVKDSNAYLFDSRALERWGFKESALPAGSTVLYRQPNVWQSYKWYFLGGLSLCVAQMVLILFLMRQRRNLRESRGRLDAIVKSAMDAIVVVDERHRIVMFNDAAERIFRCRATEAIAKPLERFIPPQFHAALGMRLPGWGELRGSEARITDGLQGVRADDERFPIEASVSQLEFEGKKVFTLILRDVTERKRSEEMLADLSGRLIAAHEEERTRIARELHDDLSQRMALLQIKLDQFEQETPALTPEGKGRLHDVAGLAGEISSDIHNLSHDLHPQKLDSLGLPAAMEGLCREFGRQHSMRVEFQAQGVQARYAKDVTLCLFRVAQEAVRNAAKHSDAAVVKVELRGKDDGIELSVRDDGAGFDPESATGRRGLGLISMRERVRALRGRLTIESNTGKGARIVATVPVARAAHTSSESEAQRTISAPAKRAASGR